MDDFGRRRWDSLENKILRVAAIVGALGTIGFGINWVGSTQFANKEENAKEHTIMQKDVLSLQSDVKYIKEGITEIKEAVKK